MVLCVVVLLFFLNTGNHLATKGEKQGTVAWVTCETFCGAGFRSCSSLLHFPPEQFVILAGRGVAGAFVEVVGEDERFEKVGGGMNALEKVGGGNERPQGVEMKCWKVLISNLHSVIRLQSKTSVRLEDAAASACSGSSSTRPIVGHHHVGTSFCLSWPTTSNLWEVKAAFLMSSHNRTCSLRFRMPMPYTLGHGPDSSNM
eukprot:3426673-Amphidinium_carterae.1